MAVQGGRISIRHASVALLKDRDDLRFAELRLLHGTSWQGKHARKLYFSGVRDQGEVTEVTKDLLYAVRRRS